MMKTAMGFAAALALLTGFGGLGVSVANAAARVDEEFFVQDPNREHFGILSMNRQLTLDHPTRDGYEVYGPKGTREILNQLGVTVRNIKMSNKDNPDYPSFPQVEARIKEIVAKNPRIMKLESIGKSNQGRDLWVVKVSDNPTVDESEPEVKYISSMHGNEITGRELMLRLLDDIGTGYAAGDAEITNLVNNTEIYIMPSMNPDGSELRQRANARGFDLNRDFPDFTTDNNNSPAGRQVETQAVMAFQASRNFALSANFHGGAEVVNYPWDTESERHPFDRLVQELSMGYSKLAPYIYESSEFNNGITNGYDWYEVDGGMQDWSYNWYNDLQVTVELSNDKWPDYVEIPRFYEMNKAAMLHYLGSVHQGTGFVIDGEVKVPGKVKILKLKEDGSVEADLGSYSFERSEFYKVLEKGRYRFAVETTGTAFKTEFDAVVGGESTLTNGNIKHLAP